MNRGYSVLFAAAWLLVGCANDPTIIRDTGTMLEPMPKPASLPQEITWSGKDAGVDKLISAEGDMVTWQQVEGSESGCTWTNDGWFAPTSSWKGCNSSDGTQQAVKTGDIWPLEIGKTETYQVTGKNASDSWQTTRTCEVKSVVLVTVAERDIPAYEVTCEDKWRVQTWYISPELQRVVRYKNWHNRRGLLTDVTLAL
ncbi:MAG: hypothetical protein RLN99_13425 [Kiloniellaceae bacterium]